MSIDETQVIKAYQERFPNFPWTRFFEADRAVNWELWLGPLPSNYWTEVDPLDEYEWHGWEQGMRDIRSMLEDLPGEVFWDSDFDELLDTDPWENEDNWVKESDEYDEDYRYIGPMEYYTLDTAETLLYKEVWRMI